MDLKSMRYFITIAREGSITKASQALHMTQPNLSRQIMMLEEELGAKLFIRTNKRSELTEDGRKLLQRFDEILSLVDKTEQEFLGEKGAIQGRIAIGAIESAAIRVVAERIAKFQRQYPQVNFDIITANGDDLKEKLAMGLLDFIFLTEPVDVTAFAYLRLGVSDRWGVLVSREHPLASQDTIRISQLPLIEAYVPRRSLLRQEIDSWLGISEKPAVLGTYSQLLGIIPVLECDTQRATAVCLEGAAGLYPSGQLKFIPISPQKEAGNLMIWKKDRMFHPAARLFHKAMVEGINEGIDERMDE